MSPQTYRLRKAQGLCPRCAARWGGWQVYCAACRARQAQRTSVVARTRTAAQLVGHCGAWYRVEALPFTCPRCNDVLFEEREVWLARTSTSIEGNDSET